MIALLQNDKLSGCKSNRFFKCSSKKTSANAVELLALLIADHFAQFYNLLRFSSVVHQQKLQFIINICANILLIFQDYLIIVTQIINGHLFSLKTSKIINMRLLQSCLSYLECIAKKWVSHWITDFKFIKMHLGLICACQYAKRTISSIFGLLLNKLQNTTFLSTRNFLLVSFTNLLTKWAHSIGSSKLQKSTKPTKIFSLWIMLKQQILTIVAVNNKTVNLFKARTHRQLKKIARVAITTICWLPNFIIKNAHTCALQTKFVMS